MNNVISIFRKTEKKDWEARRKAHNDRLIQVLRLRENKAREGTTK